MQKHSLPSQYVPETDYRDSDNIKIITDAPIRFVSLPVDSRRKSTFILLVKDTHPGFKRPVTDILAASIDKSKLISAATTKYSAAAAHRRPYLTYIIKEIMAV